MGIAVFKLKNHSLIRLHGDRPKLALLPFELVKPQSWCIHVINALGLIQ